MGRVIAKDDEGGGDEEKGTSGDHNSYSHSGMVFRFDGIGKLDDHNLLVYSILGKFAILNAVLLVYGTWRRDNSLPSES